MLNFLGFATSEGYILIVVQGQRDMHVQMSLDPDKTNMHKPVLAQHAAFLTRFNGGDASWLREKFPRLQAFIRNYHEYRRHAATDLYYWKDDLAIGVDNDPSTFFRPPGSITESKELPLPRGIAAVGRLVERTAAPVHRRQKVWLRLSCRLGYLRPSRRLGFRLRSG